VHPVLVQLGPLRIYSYGVLIALGGYLSVRFWKTRAGWMGLKKEEDFWLFVNVLLLGGFAGGRLLYLFEYTKAFSPEFWDALVSPTSGFSVLGAFFGVTGGLWWLSRRTGAPLPKLLDGVCLMAPVWHAFGRLGCLMAGCCFGRPTSGFGVTFTHPLAQVDADLLGRKLHATQLYEAAGDLVLAAALYWAVLPAAERGRLKPGAVAAGYFAGYALIRFFVEFYRGDTVPGPLGLTMGQLLSFALLAGGLTLGRRSCSRS
jgi:phosphatidylglycerol:prolipoprotein diacylglycerol transferase